jgi:uncharacterized membrane protein
MTGSHDRLSRAARPAHPPFTAFPIAAYVFAAAFDTGSVIGGPRHLWAAQLWHAGTFVLIAGLVTCLAAMGTGFRDLVRLAWHWAGDGRPGGSPGASTTTIAGHVAVVAATFMIGSGDLAWRLSDQAPRATAPLGAAALSVAAAVAACTGGFLGGKLVFSHGIGVRQAPARTDLAPARGDLPLAHGDLDLARGDLPPAGGDLPPARRDLALADGDLVPPGGGPGLAGGGPAAESDLPESGTGHDHGRGAQDAQGARGGPPGPDAAVGGRRRRMR